MASLNVSRARSFSVELRRVSLTRGDRVVLRSINWRVATGERWVLVGANGAGKTQLLKLLAGLVWPTPTGREQRRYRVNGQAFDEPALVLDDIAYIGAEKHDRYDRYGWNFSVEAVVGTGIHRSEIPQGPLTPAQRRRIRRLLAKFGLEHCVRRRFLELSYGERRLVLIARALASRPRLLLLDEVANGLDLERQQRLLRWLESTARSRMPWVLATHHVADVPRCTTHLLALDRGRSVAQHPAPRSSVIEWLRSAQVVGRAQRPRRRRQRAQRGPCLVRLSRASVFHESRAALRRIDLAVHAGECWVVSGANGSGKSTLLRTIYGDHAVASAGAIWRRGIEPGVPLSEFKRRVGFIAPHVQSDYPRGASALEVVVSGRYSSIGLNDRMTRTDKRIAQRALRQFSLQALAARPLAELSYGQVRRVLFARAWARNPQLLLLDEPFAGLDPATRADLLARVDAFIAEGGACIMATHHRGEWPANATHRLQLRAGRVVASGPLGARANDGC